MSFSTGCRKCQKCGKMYLINLFDGGLCAECEKAEQEPIEKITIWGGEQFVSIETYQQVCKERDIAIEQLHELGYELGQKIEPCDDVVSRQNIIDTYKSCADMLSDEELEGANLVMEWVYKAPSVRPKEPTVCDIEQIREEIEREADHYDAYINADIAKGLYYAGEIMDKYTKGEPNDNTRQD